MEKINITHKTRIVLCILFLSQTIFGFSKGNYFFPGIGFKDVPLIELKKDSTLEIVKTLKEYKRIFGLTGIFDTVNHFYSSDIDNDDTNELIYFGLTSAEGYWTIIWKIEGQSYRLLGELYGKINGIGDSSHLSTLAPACCGSDCGYANLYRIADDWIDLLRSVAIFKGVTLPDSPPIREKIIINDTGRSLRTQPIINDKPGGMKTQRYGVLHGNAIVELDKGVSASATARFKDRTGRVWLFLVLDNPPNTDYNVYKAYKKENRRICGWISAHDLIYREIH